MKRMVLNQMSKNCSELENNLSVIEFIQRFLRFLMLNLILSQ